MSTKATDPRLQWFQEARFGLVIHWSLFSLQGRGTWVMHHDQLSVSHMEKVADQFNPKTFDADKWARVAVEAGMKYAVLTTRHHDGFCLFDSAVSDFTSVKRAANRDFVAEFADACRRHGLKVGFYYSLLDWRFPGYHEAAKYPESKEALVHQAHEQIRELLTNYGKVDILWFDGGWLSDIWWSIREHPEEIPKFWRSEEILSMAHKLQPGIIINNRAGLDADYDTPEQAITASDQDRAWEVCQTIGDFDQSWSYQRYTPRPIRKTTGQLLVQLVTIARQGGNFLLNVGPSPDGEIPEEDVRRLKEMGEWMRTHGEAIYNSERTPIRDTSVGKWSFKGRTGYLHLFSWAGEELIVVEVDGEVESVQLLTNGQPLHHTMNKETGRLIISGLPKDPPHPDVNVVKVVFKERPKTRKFDDRSWWVNAEA